MRTQTYTTSRSFAGHAMAIGLSGFLAIGIASFVATLFQSSLAAQRAAFAAATAPAEVARMPIEVTGERDAPAARLGVVETRSARAQSAS